MLILIATGGKVRSITTAHRKMERHRLAANFSDVHLRVPLLR